MNRAEPAVEQQILGLAPDGPKVVAIGGGHGLAQALHAIQTYAGQITAVVTVADDGGSSGRLTEALDLPPPGDLRRCLLALTPQPTLWGELFAYRFDRGDVAGHSLGNLMLAALTDVFGDFNTALMVARSALEAQGDVIPAADEYLRLRATVDGQTVEGQVAIAQSRGQIRDLELIPGHVEANRQALERIGGADQIVLAPGSLFTSLLSTLIVPGLIEAVDRSSAPIAYVLNIVTQDGETLNMTGAQHVLALHERSGLRRAGTIVAHRGAVEAPVDLQAVEINEDEALALGWDLVSENVLDSDAGWPQHDPIRLGRVLAALARR
ncbi:MAG: uridine diphosphate-N-acetylglucosamine-binding protein YvcK [Acidimicrobiia bacterium]|nr:uridine diphosphate-N-acetylglucosamine-binding protein YvcK [Acidimicrobiia bacterium]